MRLSRLGIGALLVALVLTVCAAGSFALVGVSAQTLQGAGQSCVFGSLHGQAIRNQRITYDPAGNPTKVDDVARDDHQCYDYDDHARLTQAWTPQDGDCGATPASGLLGGPAPYWQSWTFNDRGLRATQTTHTAAGDRTDTYTYPDAGQPHQNAVTSLARTLPNGSNVDLGFSYDESGNTTTRPDDTTTGASIGDQELTWDAQGKLATLTRPGDGGKTEYVYGVDGELLLRSSPTETVLFHDGLEVRWDKTTEELSATRHYQVPFNATVTRTSNDEISYLVTDLHQTPIVAVDGYTLEATDRYTTPYGEPRGTDPDAWPDTHRFLNKPHDHDTGLTSIGARQYDPAIGRFISVDPLLDPASPPQTLGYAYANNNPITNEDPSGLINRQDPMTTGRSEPQYLTNGYGFTDEQAAKYLPVDKTPRPTGSDADRCSSCNFTRDMVDGFKSLFTHPVRTTVDVAVATVDSYRGCAQQRSLGACKDVMIDVGLSVATGGLGTAIRKSNKAGRIARAERKTKSRTSAAKTGARTCLRSFAGTTLILMADGTKKPIEDIEVGDRVVATDPETGERVTRKVTKLWIHDDQLSDLKLGDGTVLTTTEDHLFWSVTDRTFERADHLAHGEVVLGDNGREVTVDGFEAGTERTALAYNLSIAGVHTYHVGDGAVLVHNDCSDAAYQGVQHIRDEIAREGKNGSHSWAARMSDDELGSYLDGFITRGGGQRLDDGALGWYDPDRGIAIIQRNEYSMTGYSMSYSDFLGRLAN